MGMLEKFLGAKCTAVSSDMVRGEIAHAEVELAPLRTNLDGAMASIATMTDAEHVKAEADIAATKRAIERLEVRISQLTAALPVVVSAEQAAAKQAANEALRRRREAAHKANTKEAAGLLQKYDALAAQVADIFGRLEDISTETNEVNSELRLNPIANTVEHYQDLHRKHPDREASEQREIRSCWLYNDGSVEEAQVDLAGNPKRPEPKWDYHTQGHMQPRLERLEVVVSQTSFRRGRYEDSFSNVYLPGGFAGSNVHWPRRKQ